MLEAVGLPCALPFDGSTMKDLVEIIIDKIFVDYDNGA